MKLTLLIPTLLLAVITAETYAQPPAKQTGKTENIVIRKKGNVSEKLTIVIDGDKVTVNGKPLSQYSNENLEIMAGSDSLISHTFVAPPVPAPMPPAAMHIPHQPGIAPVPPIPPRGGAKMMIRELRRNDNKAFLGVATSNAKQGALINDVTEESPAQKSGLQEGDIITKINDIKIETAEDLVKAVGKFKPGTKVTVTYLRGEKQTSADVTLAENNPMDVLWNREDHLMGAPLMRNFDFTWMDNKPRLGIRIQDTENNTGVKVLEIDDEESPAARAGLKEDDVITAVNGKPVQSVKDIKEGMQDVKFGDKVTLTYNRDGKSQTATVSIPKSLQTSDL